jgi:hypothetical protein
MFQFSEAIEQTMINLVRLKTDLFLILVILEYNHRSIGEAR